MVILISYFSAHTAQYTAILYIFHSGKVSADYSDGFIIIIVTSLCLSKTSSDGMHIRLRQSDMRGRLVSRISLSLDKTYWVFRGLYSWHHSTV